MASSIALVAEEQVSLIIVAIMMTTTSTEEQLKRETVEGFGEVNTRLNSLTYEIWQRIPEENVLQKVGEIGTRNWIQNV